MRYIFPFIVLLLNGCWYSNGCIYTPQMVNCVDKGEVFPSVARYQKPYSLGKTDSNQRWKDVVSCGGKYMDYNQENIPIKKQENFYSCMLNKGYILLSPARCGTQDPKWNAGKCNF
ncbi:hypothetical protein BKK51_10930 [Rodentibacter trehalosifermentans]|uniref:Uncharacterized protein n=1 Tax=Rodentibacter trehalosifermentans TaxID=1908263 RepID=A0A1V3INR9_9PAST|nr:hypothetical protein [Rodentibacter trehalosifermentans]OOF43823.1 hypothetical protein BKK51_10930 [Rodentibacter trehalosifermentans]OOF45020.1 hypothetical protein BKK52_12955 [Rodentibacter trehalosifermentans]